MPHVLPTTKADERLASFVAVALGGFAGVLALQLATLKPRWTAALILGALLLVTVIVVRNRYTFHLACFVLSLQMGLSTTFMYPGSESWVGRSGPAGLEIHLVALLALGTLLARYASFRRDGLRLRWPSHILRPTLLMFATLFLSACLSQERLVGLFTLVYYAQLFLVYFVTFNVVRSDDDVRRVTIYLLAMTVSQSLVYFLQYAMGMTVTLVGDVIETPGAIDRNGGTVSTAVSAFATFMNPLLMTSASFFLAGAGAGLGKLSALATIAGAATMVLTFTRAAWIGCVLGLGLLLVVGGARGWIQLRKMLPFLLASGLLLLLLVPQILLVGTKDHATDLDERVALQRMALNVIAAHPFVGVGPGAYGYVFRAYLTPDLQDKWLFVVHNVYLLRAAEAGIPGLMAFIFWLVAAFRLALRCSRSESIITSRMGLAVMAGLVAVGFQFYWDTGTGFPQHALIWFFLGLLEALSRREREATQPSAHGALQA